MSSPKLRGIVGAVLAVAVAGPAAARAASRRTASEQQALIDDARATFVHLRDDPGLEGFRENERAARAFLIIPRAVRVGLIMGGSGGPGVVVARRAGSWSGPSFYTLATASFGPQIGVDVSEIVVFVMTRRGLDALLSPSVRAGMDVSVAAGPVGIGAGRPARPDTDFVYYSRSRGFYGGASLEGAVIRPDDGSNAAYYGRSASAGEIFQRSWPRDAGSRLLLETVEDSTRLARR